MPQFILAWLTHAATSLEKHSPSRRDGSPRNS